VSGFFAVSTAIVLLFVLASACGANASGDTGAEGPVSGAAAGDSGADGGAGVWRPRPGTNWQWQLSGPVDGGFDVVMYDIDLFDTPAATMAALRSAGRVVICYFSAGSHEDWRPDAARFPAEATGNRLEGWHGERWLDIRVDAVRALMVARLDLAVEKGCDGVEPDNVDGYANDSGFSLTPDDQLDFNRFLAAVAHARGLSVGSQERQRTDPDAGRRLRLGAQRGVFSLRRM